MVQMDRYDEAEESLKQAVQLSRTDSRARLELGNLYLLTDRENTGVCLLREALAIDPLSEEPPRALAVALMRASQYAEAEKILRDALRKLDEANAGSFI